ncbi:Uma2 family endonuclease [Actinomycetospora sp. OC33-EN08]|uniref:Uma2 family endonuclease n=1 Tax=Actinomycetospora aurantiaca TaxID=3129233 RepID=A0ABU8MVV6_9PSEU
MSAEALVRALPPHPIGLEEWDALPEGLPAKVELLEGVLMVWSRPSARHQRVAVLVMNALAAALPPEWCAVPELDVLIEGGPTPTVRAPDVVVIRTATADHRTRQDPADVLLAVEVQSPGSRRTDRVAKLAEYAEVGIAHYLLVEPGPPVVLTELVLDGGSYRVRAEHRGTAELALGATIDLDAPDRT